MTLARTSFGWRKLYFSIQKNLDGENEIGVVLIKPRKAGIL
jgi:hypothetical protein